MAAELDMEGVKKDQSLVGGFQWIMMLGRFDLATSTMSMASFRVPPPQNDISTASSACVPTYTHLQGRHCEFCLSFYVALG